jgi:hypothetical protein
VLTWLPRTVSPCGSGIAIQDRWVTSSACSPMNFIWASDINNVITKVMGQ